MEERISDSLIIGVDHANGDNMILIVGRKKPEQNVDIINAFQGKEAKHIYELLITKKENK